MRSGARITPRRSSARQDDRFREGLEGAPAPPRDRDRKRRRTCAAVLDAPLAVTTPRRRARRGPIPRRCGPARVREHERIELVTRNTYEVDSASLAGHIAAPPPR